jgi:undecaprenyl-diphosphatase
LGFFTTSAVLLALAAVLVARSADVNEFDQDVMVSMSALRDPMLTAVAQIITSLGSLWPVTVFSIVVAVVVGYRAQRLLEPAVMLLAVEVSTKLVGLLKVTVGRARPPLDGMLGAPVFDYSFPSDHTASGAVVYVLGALLLTATDPRNSRGRLLVTTGCVMGGLIGVSRIYLGYHWFTDIVGGWLLAALVTSLGMIVITACRRPDLDVVGQPVAPPSAFSQITRLVVGSQATATVGEPLTGDWAQSMPKIGGPALNVSSAGRHRDEKAAQLAA